MPHWSVQNSFPTFQAGEAAEESSDSDGEQEETSHKLIRKVSTSGQIRAKVGANRRTGYLKEDRVSKSKPERTVNNHLTTFNIEILLIAGFHEKHLQLLRRFSLPYKDTYDTFAVFGTHQQCRKLQIEMKKLTKSCVQTLFKHTMALTSFLCYLHAKKEALFG